MNIQFKEIDIDKFRSINHIHLVLQEQGIVIVKGINDYEETASSNGSGKSSMFEAIIFALFEETSSGDKNVENRLLNDGYKIDLKFSIDGVDYEVIRQLQNNKTSVSLYKNNQDISAKNKTDTNKLIISTLGITKDIFLDSIMLSQSVTTNLTTLSPTSRKERLELLTDTNTVIDNFKEQLKQKQLYYESLRVENVNKYNTYTGNIQTLQSEIKTFEQRIEELEQKQKELDSYGTIQYIENGIKDKTNEIEKLEDEVLTITNESKTLQQTHTDLNNKQLELRECTSKISLQKLDIENNVTSLKAKIDMNIITKQYKQQEIDKITKEIAKIKNSDTCPTCGRKYDNFDDTHIKTTIEDYNKEIEHLQKEQATLDLENKDIEEQIKQLQVDIDSLQQELDKYTTQIEDSSSQARNILDNINQMNQIKDDDNIRIQGLLKQVQQLQERKTLLEQSSNKDTIQEYTQIVKDLTSKVDEIQIEITDVHNRIQDNADLVEVCKHCIQLVTKEFRTYLLTNSINFLNNVLSNYSKSLFSNDKDVIYIDETDSKLNIYLGDATYESLSGGEKTRVDIALLLAQKSLASTIGNISSNIIILDEVLKFCDGTTEINIIDLLVKELDSLESIYMISHKEIPIGYDNQLIVTKNKDGLSSII